MDIVKERLRREFQIETIFTVPSVVYLVKLRSKSLAYKLSGGNNITNLIK
jgi:translation elongation factor EF-4